MKHFLKVGHLHYAFGLMHMQEIVDYLLHVY